MQNLVNSVKGHALSFAESLTPVLKNSKFKETGVITPDEFVAAGDFLVHQCPTYSWASGDEKKTKSYLPKDKQFLITRNVPCYQRVSQISNHTLDMEAVVEASDDNEGWVDTHHNAEVGTAKEVQSDMTTQENDDDDDEGEAIDMDEFVAEGGLEMEDEAAVCPPVAARGEHGDVLATRTYDLHITYDNYYRTPRLWLTGYDVNKQPLTVEQMYEDISEDHAQKTVTMEHHPHLAGPPRASVHPCRHSEVMKKLIETMSSQDKQVEVFMYLLIFLKFVQAVIPTIEYDFTRNFKM